ncbi:MAG: hypothetical protein LBC67_05980, partial [Spirochaetales bacterium]|nr:hypothetical protein [Spirochaetales bacterium]
MDSEEIAACVAGIAKEKGREGDLARAILEYRECSYTGRERCSRALTGLLLAGEPASLALVFDNGPRALFARVHGDAAADFAGKAAARFTSYVHSPSVYRRSFRTREISAYMPRFTGFLESLLFFPWEHFDMLGDLSTPRGADEGDAAARRFPQWFYGDFLAVRIDEGDEGIIEAVKNTCLGENNTRLLSDGIINGIIKSGNKELYALLGGMLVAAKREEGLRQSILENADNGRVEAFIYLMKVVLDNGLVRFSSVVRALDVWLGLAEGFDDTRTCEKLLRLCYAELTDKKALRLGLEGRDVLEIYAGLWALSVREMSDVVQPIERLLQGEQYQKLAGLYFLRQLENEKIQFAVTSGIIAGFGAAGKGGAADKAGAAGKGGAGAKSEREALELLSLTLASYPVKSSYPWRKEEFLTDCRQNV